MRTDPSGLHDQFEFGQLLNQLARHVGPVSVEHDHVGIFESHRQLAQALDGVGVNLGLVGLQSGRAFELANRVLVIIKNHNIHTERLCLGNSPDARERARLSCGYCRSVKSGFARSEAIQFGAYVCHAARDDHATDLSRRLVCFQDANDPQRPAGCDF